MIRILLILSILALAGCSDLTGAALRTAAGAALGGEGGPSLDVQAGRTNARSLVGEAASTEQRFAPVVRDTALESLEQRSRQSNDQSTVSGTEKIENLTVKNSPPWLILAFAVALFLDSPLRWPGQIAASLRSRDNA